MKKYEKMVEKERVFNFFHSLNADLDEVRGSLLGTKPFPSIREAIVEVRTENKKRRAMMRPSGMTNSDANSQALALVSSRTKPSNPLKEEPHKEKLWCKHYKKPYQTKDTC